MLQRFEIRLEDLKGMHFHPERGEVVREKSLIRTYIEDQPLFLIFQGSSQESEMSDIGTHMVGRFFPEVRREVEGWRGGVRVGRSVLYFFVEEE
jgi:hypothetical protein